MTPFNDGPCTRAEADDDDIDRYEIRPPQPATKGALSRELRHFRDMARIESHEPTAALWRALAEQVEAYLNPAAGDAPALFETGTHA